MEAHTVQPTPSMVEIDAQDQVDAISPWVTLVMVPIILAGVAVIQKWVPSKSDHVSAVTTAYRDQMQVMATQIQSLVEQQSSTQVRLAQVEDRLSNSQLRGDRSVRIAHRALDRVDDHRMYLDVREAARQSHDPDGVVTPWVPEPPPHLVDREWTQVYRTQLDSLDDL